MCLPNINLSKLNVFDAKNKSRPNVGKKYHNIHYIHELFSTRFAKYLSNTNNVDFAYENTSLCKLNSRQVNVVSSLRHERAK